MAKPAAAPAAKTGAAPLAAVKPGVPPATPPTGNKKSKLLWIVLALMVLGAGGGAAWYFFGQTPPAAEGAEHKASAHAPLFLALDPFTVNLAEDSGDHYLQAGIVYQVADEKVTERMKQYMPVVRNRILLLLSAKRPSDIVSADGKRKLVDELVTAARESTPGTTPDKGITGALFSSFVIQ